MLLALFSKFCLAVLLIMPFFKRALEGVSEFSSTFLIQDLSCLTRLLRRAKVSSLYFLTEPCDFDETEVT